MLSSLDPKAAGPKAIVTLRKQLQELEGREELIFKKIQEEEKKAIANASRRDKSAEATALRQKRLLEQELERTQGQRAQLEAQLKTLESANINAPTMEVMEKGADALDEEALEQELAELEAEELGKASMPAERVAELPSVQEPAAESRKKVEEESEEESELRKLQAEMAI